MRPRYHSSAVDPRRLSMLDHQRLSQTHGERRRIHGPILAASDETVRRANWIARMVAVVVIAILVMTVIAPGGRWMASQLIADWEGAVNDATLDLERPIAP